MAELFICPACSVELSQSEMIPHFVEVEDEAHEPFLDAVEDECSTAAFAAQMDWVRAHCKAGTQPGAAVVHGFS